MKAIIADYTKIPAELLETALDWYKGDDAAMKAFADAKPCDAHALVVEVGQAIAENVKHPDDMPKLRRLEAFARSITRQSRAKARLHSAMVEASDSGLSEPQIIAWMTAVFDHGKMKIAA